MMRMVQKGDVSKRFFLSVGGGRMVWPSKKPILRATLLRVTKRYFRRAEEVGREVLMLASSL